MTCQEFQVIVVKEQCVIITIEARTSVPVLFIPVVVATRIISKNRQLVCANARKVRVLNNVAAF